jgi:hypothetical protein
MVNTKPFSSTSAGYKQLGQRSLTRLLVVLQLVTNSWDSAPSRLLVVLQLVTNSWDTAPHTPFSGTSAGYKQLGLRLLTPFSAASTGYKQLGTPFLQTTNWLLSFKHLKTEPTHSRNRQHSAFQRCFSWPQTVRDTPVPHTQLLW